MKLTEREHKILLGISIQDGVHTARKIWRIFYVKGDAYKVVWRLWRMGLIRAPWLRLYITPYGRSILDGGREP